MSGTDRERSEPRKSAREASDWSSHFDAVVILSWSDWHREPRSNRFHYATRFAQTLPVYFIQIDGHVRETSIEKVDGHDIHVVHMSWQDDDARTSDLTDLLRSRGVDRPLLWIYNTTFERYIAFTNAPFRVYHATEDHFGTDWPADSADTRAQMANQARRVLAHCDLVVAVSDGVARNIRDSGAYRGDMIVAPNGCDAEFWRTSGAHHFAPPADAPNVALYQGAINCRLDFELLTVLVDRLPHWQFQFCGSVSGAPEAWTILSQRRNVRYLGELSPQGIAEAAARARVGLVPFVQADYIRISLPLKAYEYVACGLPVVSVPIDTLAQRPDLFRIGSDAEALAVAIEEVGATRHSAPHVSRRLAAAAEASYDNRFAEVGRAIVATLTRRARRRPRLNVLILYDERSVHVKTVREHLDAFSLYSHHRYYFLSATGPWGPDSPAMDFQAFDAVAIHYSVRVSLAQHISEQIAASVTAFQGPKLLFIQDEYDTTETARRWIERLGIDAVFTNVPLDSIEHVYPRRRFANVDFIPTLTGYIPEDEQLEDYITPLAERTVLIGYRGRRLPHQYGRLGYDKFRIGVEVQRRARERGLPIDIEVDDAKRIYDGEWYRFLGSCRATLGTESGCNLFDNDGAFAKLAAQHADLDFEEFAARFLPDGEGPVVMNQVSPKIFEAIRLRTALVLFEGRYSDVVQADRHYIPLAPDFSNLDEVFTKLQDLDFLKKLTDRAYRDVIGSSKYTLGSFVEGVDTYLFRRAAGRRRATIFSTPLFAASVGSHTRPLQRNSAFRFISDQIVPNGVMSQDALAARARADGVALFPSEATRAIGVTQSLELAGPVGQILFATPEAASSLTTTHGLTALTRETLAEANAIAERSRLSLADANAIAEQSRLSLADANAIAEQSRLSLDEVRSVQERSNETLTAATAQMQMQQEQLQLVQAQLQLVQAQIETRARTEAHTQGLQQARIRAQAQADARLRAVVRAMVRAPLRFFWRLIPVSLRYRMAAWMRRHMSRGDPPA